MSTLPSPPSADTELHAQQYNNDLLLTENDQQRAKRNFPDVYHVLDFPHLREKFQYYNEAANRHRRMVRRVGLLAIALSAVGLIKATMLPLVHPQLTPPLVERVADATFEVIAIVGMVVAIGGLVIYRRKSKWLRMRLMTERLRQFHFQVMVRKWPEVVASCKDDAARDDYLAKREKWLDDFLAGYDRNLAPRLAELIGRPKENDCWVVPDSPHTGSVPAAPRQLVEAYRTLRIDHQINYCRVKLATDHSGSLLSFLEWPLASQEYTLRVLSFILILSALITSLLTIVGNLFDVAPLREEWLFVLIVVTFILGAAVRAAEEGLAIAPEMERYEDYEAQVEITVRRFETAEDDRARREAMVDMEQTAFAELRGFLRTTRKARFVL
jgi:hypothetical protein